MLQTTIKFSAIMVAFLVSTYISNVEAKDKYITKMPSCYSKATLTKYWISKEGTEDLNDDEHVTLRGSKTKKLKDKNGKVLAKTNKLMYEKMEMEGVGMLENGKIYAEDKEVFEEMDREVAPYGVGDHDNPLLPWISVATNDAFKPDSTLYIKELDGIEVVKGVKHNGCVRVDDSGASFGDCQLDFFVLTYKDYKRLDEKLDADTVHVTMKDCELLDYQTPQVMKWTGIENKIAVMGGTGSLSKPKLQSHTKTKKKIRRRTKTRSKKNK